jgi:hypothetical protein
VKLLQEFVDIKDLKLLKEAVTEGCKNKKNYYIEGPFLQAEIQNENSRIYPLEVATEAVEKYQDKIKKRMALGEYMHSRLPEINLERVSHLVEKLEMSGNDGIGRAKVIDTPMGRIAQVLIEENILFGISTRGVGDVGDDNKVMQGYELVAPDIVSDPSAPKCVVEGICESKDWIIGPDGHFMEQPFEKMKQGIDKKFDGESATRLLNEFIKTISSRR